MIDGPGVHQAALLRGQGGLDRGAGRAAGGGPQVPEGRSGRVTRVPVGDGPCRDSGQGMAPGRCLLGAGHDHIAHQPLGIALGESQVGQVIPEPGGVAASGVVTPLRQPPGDHSGIGIRACRAVQPVVERGGPCRCAQQLLLAYPAHRRPDPDAACDTGDLARSGPSQPLAAMVTRS